MKCKIFLWLLIILGALQGEEIRVYLSTTSPLEAIYIGQLQSSDQSLPPPYLEQLKTVLDFDFNHNSFNKVLQTHPEREKALQSSSLAGWKNCGAPYVIKGEVREKGLSISLFSSQTGTLKHFPPISLTGVLSQDRRQIHRLADAICKLLYGQEGVASTRILYSVKQKSGEKWIAEIWSCDWDGANAKQITREGSYCVTPVLIPPSQHYSNDRFLYVSYKMGQPKIFIASLSEGKGKRILDLHGNQLLPAISAQRNKIAFICDANHKTADLFLQEFHPEQGSVGKPVQLFSYPRSTQASPSFNPNGSQIAFVSDKDGSPRIYTIPASFTSKRPTPVLITKKNQENSCPNWSPDGKKLAYSAKTKGTRQIWIFDFETGQEWQLTDGGGNKENPSWAPDSRHLVFNSTDGHISELYTVNLNQPEVIKISQGAGIKHYPTWGTR